MDELSSQMRAGFAGAGGLPRRVVAGMSGGVDSTFAAWALARLGVEVIGIHLKLGDFGPAAGGPPRCCSLEDSRDARKVAAALGIPFYVVSVADDFRREVIAPFAYSYAQGLTPNPCVLCNPRIKWKALIAKARELGADAVATGHHARIALEPGTGRRRLLSSVEKKKDQSYFLARLSPEQLSWAALPAGNFEKRRIRELLAGAGIAVAGKAESQDVCFTGPGGYAEVVERCLGDAAPAGGELVDLSGRVVGTHAGVHRYTIGQRKGLNLSRPEPWYVVGLEPEENRVVVGPGAAVWSSEAWVRELSWLAAEMEEGPGYAVRVRYKARPAAARVSREGEDLVRLTFNQPQRAVAPGQTAVFYRGNEVAGAGTLVRPPGDRR